MNQLLSKPRYALILILFFLFTISLINLGSWGVIETSEARYAEISREMVDAADWMHPTLLGIKHYHKPPVTYWITAIGYKIFGVNAFGARFFLIVSYLLQILLVYFIARKILASDTDGLVAAVIYSSLPIVLTSARGLTTDSYLNTFILTSLASWIQWKSSGRIFWLYLIAGCLGLGSLTKGPVVLIVPVLVMLGVKPFVSVNRISFTAHYILAVLVFLAIGLSWFVALVLEDKNFIDYFLFRHTIERYAAAGVFKRSEPWWYYFAYAPLLAFPWILVLFFKVRNANNHTSFRVIRQILIFWVGIPLVFFSISSSKLVLYVLPLYAGVALVCTYWLRMLSQKQVIVFERIWLGYTGLMAVGLAVFFFGYKEIELPLWVRSIPFLFLLLMIVLRQRKSISLRMKPLVYGMLLTAFLMFVSSSVFRYNELKVNTTQPIAEWIERNGMSERQIMVYNRLLPSLSFHLQKQIVSLQDGNHNLNREIQFESDSTWRDNLFELNNEEDKARLLSILQEPAVLVVKGKFKPSAEWLEDYFSKRQKLGEWSIFYN
ncbi:MAG: phospholipid carrier-dependent glycosyltransferase [Cyclobacteriaceae bacterium]|nr:phospholipid carrier-dependent glycosyltransferase [Cyclobacteriaceae bacterium]